MENVKKGRKMRDLTIKTTLDEKIITIIRGVEREKLVPLAEALYAGGIRMLELTYDAKGVLPDIENAKNIEMLVKKFEGRMLVGAGTVIRENQVELTRAAGGTFIISPDTCQRIIEKTRELDMVSMPGALTPTEIAAAHSYGADFVKLFPVNVFGVDYVKAVKAPLSHVKLLAVGGVDENNIADYLKAGAVGFGIGSGVVKKCLIDANDFDGVCALAEKYTKAIGK